MERIIKNKGLSLKKGLLVIMALCWLLPIMGIIGYSGYSISHNVQGRIEDTITTSVDMAFMQTVDTIRGAMDASRALSYDETIENAYKNYIKNNDGVILYDTVTNYLLQKYGYDDRFNAAFLFFTYDPDKIYYTTKRTNTREYSGLHNYQYSVHQEILDSYNNIGTRISFMKFDYGLYMVRNIVDSSFNPYAVIVMECDEETIFESLRSIVWLKDSRIKINGIDLNILNNSTQDFMDEDGVWYDRKTGYYTIQASHNLDYYNIVLNVISDSSDLVNELPNLIGALPYLAGFAVILMLFLLWAYYHYVSHPMDMLIHAAERMESGERGYTIEQAPHSREFRYMTKRFNSMSQQLKYQFERIYEEQTELQNARVMALRSQINPHFLNNTLESILWAARISKDEPVCKMIEALSIMLNAAMARGGSARGTVKQEIAYTDAYLYISSIRLRDRLTIVKEIDKETLGALVPCLILQPIVENAIDHGIALIDKGTLSLRSYLEDSKLILEVENCGKLSKKDKERIACLLNPDDDDECECIGIKNVNRRLKILYGELGSLTIYETENSTVLSKIVIPNVEFMKQ